MNDPALVFKNVSVRYESGHPPVVEGASFTVAEGERVALLGLNGSGKTTVLMAAAGLLPHQGEIRVCGTALGRTTLKEIRSRIGFLFNVPEDQLLFPKVVDDVAFGLRRRAVPVDESKARAVKALAALRAADLSDAPLHHLSHGQKQRVALAGALVTEPPLLLLDEPSAGLDPPGKDDLADHLRGLSAAMLIATHELAFAAAVCRRFILLENGRVSVAGDDVAEVERRWIRKRDLHL